MDELNTYCQRNNLSKPKVVGSKLIVYDENRHEFSVTGPSVNEAPIILLRMLKISKNENV